MFKITCVVGTRPEAIKMAPVIMKLKGVKDFAVSLLSTGQHAEMLDQALKHFNIVPDYNLHVMKERQSLDHITSKVLEGTTNYLNENAQDMLLVHGDTTTTLAASLAAFYKKVPLGHVEAGLRSNDMTQPFPEEANRVITDRLSALCFAPTPIAAQNLLKEGISENKIWVTGNTVIDSLFWTIENSRAETITYPGMDETSPVVLVTAHRRESWGEPLTRIVSALKELLKNYESLHAVIPLHLNPEVREVFFSMLDESDRVHYTEPLDYPEFISMMKRSTFIMSDSGGIQEEASALKKPLLILRELSERPEAVNEGTGIIVGTDASKIISVASRLLDDPEELASYSRKTECPFGDGQAADRIVKIIQEYLYK
ncbi:MAG: UDP-N-acetylglucosamine 2-epimerase (non-hydrolyzing) [Synergistaceae bacterium]|nr:UDP-N-acetylglucosamine 2-epimerase (non-hydrolyzing) [Synergistaceae bacterium]